MHTAGWVMSSNHSNQSAVMGMGNLLNPFKIAFTSAGEHVITLTIYDKAGKSTEVKTRVNVNN